ncbi:SET domain-containing protein [Xenophilus aerolatus]|nr:SET domain-containing protein [Xenophilus aerolatus]
MRPSGVHGLGAFAAVDLPAGTKLGRYTGRRFNAVQVAAMDWDSTLTYLFGLSDGTLIDGGRGGNEMRHLNHACEPNCEAREEHGARGRLELGIHTLREVRAGEELFLDYALTVDAAEGPGDYPCRCGSHRCRGTMVAVSTEAA